MVRMPSVLVRNWRLKLAALGLSLFLWALVQTEPLSQETLSSVPVLVEVSDTAWTIAGAPSPAAVELRLGGPAREILRLVRGGASVIVPVSSVSSRDTVIALQRDWVQLGQSVGVTVESVSPPTLTVSFEPAITKTVPVSLLVRGELPTDLALSSELRVSPESVTVRGPESRLEGLASMPIVPLDLADVDESDIVTLPVDTSGITGASVVPPEVMVGVRVEPVIERTLDAVAVNADPRNPDVTLTVEPSAVRLRLVGARTLVTTMDLSLLRVSVPPADLAEMLPGEERVLHLRVDGVPALVTAQPETDVVTVTRLRESTEEESQAPS